MIIENNEKIGSMHSIVEKCLSRCKKFDFTENRYYKYHYNNYYIVITQHYKLNIVQHEKFRMIKRTGIFNYNWNSLKSTIEILNKLKNNDY